MRSEFRLDDISVQLFIRGPVTIGQYVGDRGRVVGEIVGAEVKRGYIEATVKITDKVVIDGLRSCMVSLLPPPGTICDICRMPMRKDATCQCDD